jgi:NTE family protein
MTGLVLAGGGAKGAYQIGAWRALRERGIEPDLVAGTSIGALNAVLIASGDLDRATTFWHGLSTARLARTEPLLLLGVVLRLVSAVAPRAHLSQALSTRGLRMVAKYGVLMVLVLSALAVGLLRLLGLPPAWVLPFGAAIVAYGLLLFLPDVAELVNGALLSRRALAGLINPCVDWTKVAAAKPAVWVTLARAAFERRNRKLTRVIPDYVRLDHLDPSVAHACLTASMALPFGIFPRIEIGDRRYMDGGLADNIPMYPAILEGCETIYVVHLTPRPRYRGLDLLDDEQLEAAMQWIDQGRVAAGEPGIYVRNWFSRRFEIAAAMREQLITDSGILAYMEPRFDRPGDGNVQFVHVVPQRRLGRGLWGTLFFSRRKTERLMARGYEDTVATLSGERTLPPRVPDWRQRRDRRDLVVVVLVQGLLLLVGLGMLWLARYLESRRR